MDPLAHTLFSASAAEAGLRRKTALATATLIIGANIPDMDALAMFISNDYALLVRRGWTHGILAMLIWPFILAGMMLGIDRLIEKWRRKKGRERKGPAMHPGWLLILAFIGVWSHPLLDWLNTYGVRLLMPFSDQWFYGDTLFIIDPWFWLLAGAGVVLARSESWKSIGGWIVLATALSALVLSADVVPLTAKIIWGAGITAIAVARWTGWYNKSGKPVALILFVLAISYSVFMYAGARMTVHHAENHLAEQGIEVTEIMANPLPARIFSRSGVAASESHYYLFLINWANPASFELMYDPIPIQEPDDIAETALSDPGLQGLRNWIRFPHYEVNRHEAGWKVIIRDLRYVRPDQQEAIGIGMAIVELDDELRVISIVD